MTPAQVVAYYGTQTKASDELGYSKQAVSKWVRLKRIPIAAQITIELKTRGQMRADLPKQIRVAA